MAQGRPTNEPSNYFAFAKQSAKDTEGATFQFLRHLDGTGIELDQTTESVREGGDGQEVGLRYKTAITTDGQSVINARPEIGARLSAYTLGADTVQAPQSLGTAASGIANEHTAIPTSTMPYLTIEQYFADEIERVTNAQITGMTIEWEQGRPLKLTHSYIGGGSAYRRDVASVLTPTRETGQPFFYPGASVVIDGAGNTKVTKGKITISRNVDDAIRTTGLTREDVVALNFDTAVELTLKYEDKTLYDKVQYGSGSQIPLDLATGALSVFSQFGAGTNIRYFQAGVNQFHYSNAKVNKLDPDGKTMYIDISGDGYRGATYQAFTKHLVASVAAFL